jgi:hypothetical protein
MFIFTAMLIMRTLCAHFLPINLYVHMAFTLLAWHTLVLVTDVSSLYVRLISKTPCSPKITTVAGQNRYYLEQSRSQRSICLTLEDRTDIFSPRISVSNYKPTPRNITEVHRTRNLKFLYLYFQVVTVLWVCGCGWGGGGSVFVGKELHIAEFFLRRHR